MRASTVGFAALGAAIGLVFSAGTAQGLEPCGWETQQLSLAPVSVVADGEALTDKGAGQWASDAGTEIFFGHTTASAADDPMVLEFSPPTCSLGAQRLRVTLTDPFTGVSADSVLEVQP